MPYGQRWTYWFHVHGVLPLSCREGSSCMTAWILTCISPTSISTCSCQARPNILHQPCATCCNLLDLLCDKHWTTPRQHPPPSACVTLQPTYRSATTSAQCTKHPCTACRITTTSSTYLQRRHLPHDSCIHICISPARSDPARRAPNIILHSPCATMLGLCL
jgi:hypothetical protein